MTLWQLLCLKPTSMSIIIFIKFTVNLSSTGIIYIHVHAGWIPTNGMLP